MNAVTGTRAHLVAIEEQTAVLGGLAWLCQFSSLHRQYPVGFLLDRVLGSLELNQFRYYEDANRVPVGFCNWALLSSTDLAKAMAGELAFGREHWRSGEHLFFAEMIAPFGHCRTIVRDIRTNIVPADVRGWSLRGRVHDGEAPAALRVQRYRNNRRITGVGGSPGNV